MSNDAFEPLDDARVAALAQFEHYREQRRRLILAAHRLRAREHLAGLLLQRMAEPAQRRDAERRVGLLQAQAQALTEAMDLPGAKAWFELVARRAHARVFASPGPGGDAGGGDGG